MIKSFYDRAFNKHTIIISVLVSSIVLFYPSFKLLYDKFIVSALLSNIRSTWYRDLFFLLLLVFTIVYSLRSFRSYRPSLVLSITSVVSCIIYTYYRLFTHDYGYYSFTFTRELYYSDAVFLLLVNPFILLFSTNKVVPTNSNAAFINDEPIGKNKVDLLGYEKYAREIAAKIHITTVEKSFAIGINGKWGYGKTSFIDLIKREIKDKNIVEIHFNPWNSGNSSAIIQDFFETFKASLSKYHASASNLLSSYSNKLVALSNSTVTQSIQASISAITGLESLDNMHGNIDSVLKQINKKFIVYIDDVDRLDKTEILEVIRLIRNTANFHNTFFIVAYDREYIISAIRELNDYSAERYLEKIFHIEINLPYFDTDILRKILYEKLCNTFPVEFHETFKEELIGTSSAPPTYLSEWIFSMRDVTRLYNSMLLNLTRLIGEVDFGDFLRVELLRINHPSVYEVLFRQTDKFLKVIGGEFERNRYTLKQRGAGDMRNELSGTGEYELKNYLQNNSNKLSLNISESEKIISLVEQIINDKRFKYFNKSILSIIYPSNFLRYFAYNLLEENLSEVQFSSQRLKSPEEFEEAIKHWVDGGLEIEVITRLKEIKEFDNLSDYKKIISAIFFLANLTSKFQRFHHGNIVGYDDRDLINKLTNHENRLVKRFFDHESEVNDLKEFLLGLFNKAKTPYTFEGDLIKQINSQFNPEPANNEFILDRTEYKNIVLKYFQQYLESEERFTGNLWYIFHYCEYKKFIPDGNSSSWTTYKDHFEEAKEMFKKFIFSKDLNGFIETIIGEEMDGGKYGVSGAILYIFKDWASFKELIFQQSEEKWSYLPEFKAFYLMFELNEPKLYIPYTFKSIPISKRKKQ